eukprot:c17218_g1_i1.p1 GENE.c17218_g1_i1~~c17218_g1_i1.p1  ORF type:complete len:228 (+),score=69.44 c17218_g1_i1:24-707(+)
MCTFLILGEWVGSGVWVRNKDDMKSLFFNGSYGKGIISKRGILGVTEEWNNSNNYYNSNNNNNNETNTNINLEEYEVLQLSLEEAFFLHSKIKVLSIYEINSNNEQIFFDINKLWTTFLSVDPQFPLSYSTYQHFKQKGWIVRSGLKYGVDFVLYRTSPINEHAECCVMIADANPELTKLPQKRNIDWSLVQNLNRLSTLVAKYLVISYVLFPSSSFNSIDCLSSFS